MRNISFMHTQHQIKAGTKDVTRRAGWKFLKEGDELRGVNKSQGLKKGEHPQTLALIRVVNVRFEQLKAITKRDVVREDFPDWTRQQFISFFCRTMNYTPDMIVTRIEFEFI